MEYNINSVEIMVSVPKSEGSYAKVQDMLREELEDPDFGDGLGYGLVKNYNLDEIDSDDETDTEYLFRVVYTY